MSLFPFWQECTVTLENISQQTKDFSLFHLGRTFCDPTSQSYLTQASTHTQIHFLSFLICLTRYSHTHTHSLSFSFSFSPTLSHLVSLSTPRCLNCISMLICSSSRLRRATRFRANATSERSRSGSYFVLLTLEVVEFTAKRETGSS